MHVTAIYTMGSGGARSGAGDIACTICCWRRRGVSGHHDTPADETITLAGSCYADAWMRLATNPSKAVHSLEAQCNARRKPHAIKQRMHLTTHETLVATTYILDHNTAYTYVCVMFKSRVSQALNLIPAKFSHLFLSLFSLTMHT